MKLKLDYAVAIGNNEHVAAVAHRSLLGIFDVRMNVRRG
jgi:hypothetical protein